MNANSCATTDYENIANWTLGENKPNTNPIKPNLVHHSLGEGGTNPIPEISRCQNEKKMCAKCVHLTINAFLQMHGLRLS